MCVNPPINKQLNATVPLLITKHENNQLVDLVSLTENINKLVL